MKLNWITNHITYHIKRKVSWFIKVSSYNAYGPLNVRAKGDFEYFIIFFMITQGMVMFIYCTISTKLLKSINKFWDKMEKQLYKNHRSLRSNRDGEYLSDDFNKYLLDNEILS